MHAAVDIQFEWCCSMMAVCLAGIMYSDPFPVYNYMQCVIEYIGNICMRII